MVVETIQMKRFRGVIAQARLELHRLSMKGLTSISGKSPSHFHISISMQHPGWINTSWTSIDCFALLVWCHFHCIISSLTQTLHCTSSQTGAYSSQPSHTLYLQRSSWKSISSNRRKSPRSRVQETTFTHLGTYGSGPFSSTRRASPLRSSLPSSFGQFSSL